MTPPTTTLDAPLPTTRGAPPALRTLADLPGPRPWPLVGNTFQVRMSRLHQDIEHWIGRYGPILKARLGRMDLVIVSDHQLITDMLKNRPEGFRRPSRLNEVIRELGVHRGVFTAEGEAWQRQRRMVMASFSPAHVRSYFPSLQRVTQRLQTRWLDAARAQRPIDLQADLMRFTVDAISGLAFGTETRTLESDDDVIQKHLDKVFPAIYRRVNAIVPYWRWVRLPADRTLDRSLKVVHQAIDEFIAQARARLQDPARRAHPANLLEAMIVAADEPDSGVDDRDVAGNVFTLLLAGEDTTATTLSWMLYLLSRNPEALARARAEALRVAPDAGAFTPEQMADLSYIEACAHEAMRLKPVGPFNAVETLQDQVVGDVLVPRGTPIFCVLRHDNLNERYFSQADRFEPQRWLDGQGLSEATNAKRVSMPFGAGPRICPGRYLALLEIKLAMAMILNTFDIVAIDTPDGRDAQELMSFTMTPVGLSLRLRESSAT